MIKALAFDLDGTLLTKKHKVLDEVKAEIDRAQSSGIEVILASGRAPIRMINYARELNVRWVVAFNGGTVMDMENNKTVHERRLTSEEACEIYDFSNQQRSGLIIYKDGYPHCKKRGVLSKAVGESQGMKVKKILRKDLANINKMFIGNFFKGKTDKAEKIARKIFLNRFEISRSSNRSLEFNPIGVNKAAGLQIVADKLNISAENFAVFGDGGNDVEMFKWAKHGVAMGNAREVLLAQSTEKIGDHNSPTIATWIRNNIK